MPQPIEFTTSDGRVLKGDLHEPSGPALATILAGHAMMANRRSLDKPAGEGLVSTLVRAGFRVAAVDMRGHGESTPLPSEGAQYSYDDIVMKDVPAVVRGLAERFPGKQVVLGHSLVGHATLAWLGTPDAGGTGGLTALVAYAPNAWLKSCEPDEKRWATKQAQLGMWAQMARQTGYFAAKKMKIGSDDVSGPYIRQFEQWGNEDRWVSLDGHDYRKGLENIRIPVLVPAGAGDKLLCVPECCERFLAPLPRERLTFWTVSEGNGFGFSPDHMPMVTDPRSRILWERTADWIRQRVS